MNLQTLDDLSRICHDEASLEYVAPDEEGRQILLPSFFRSAIRAGELYGEIHMSENGDGVAVWIRPEHHLVPRPNYDRRGATGVCANGRYTHSEKPYAPGTCSGNGGVVRRF